MGLRVDRGELRLPVTNSDNNVWPIQDGSERAVEIAPSVTKPVAGDVKTDEGFRGCVRGDALSQNFQLFIGSLLYGRRSRCVHNFQLSGAKPCFHRCLIAHGTS
jgi:hypothetical protein